MKVTHHADSHLVCLSSEEVALLIDLCHAGAFSDELVQDPGSRRRLERFLGEMQTSLYETAQRVWAQHRIEADTLTPAAHSRGHKGGGPETSRGVQVA